MKHHLVNSANQYARDVTSGKINACRYMKMTCQRHINDLKNKNSPYEFDRTKAEKVCIFIQKMPHTKGEWAFNKQRISLEPWQLFIIISVFGWVIKSSGLRRFREAYIEVPRKNGKSALSATIGIYMFLADGEYGAEVYSGATSEKQAWEIYRPARIMVSKSPALISHFKVEVNAKNLSKISDLSRFEPIIGNPGDGSSPSCSLVDEYHEHDSDSLYTTMLTGMGARLQPLMWIITTAGYDINAPCYDKRRELIEVLEGNTQNDELFGVIYTIDPEDDWTKIAALEKANPNMGVSVYRDFLIHQQQRAINNPRFTNRFKTKHLNIWVSSKASFYNIERWNACENKDLTEVQFDGHDRLLAFDMAARLDLTAMVQLITRTIDGKKHYFCVKPRFYVPEETVFDNDNRRIAERYQSFVNSGHLFSTQGAEIDYRDVLDDAININKSGTVLECPIDPHGATALAHQLADENMEPIIIKQNFTGMSDGMKELEAAINSGRFHHDGNPVLSWCVGNVIGKYLSGSDDIVRPVKETRDHKIDGAVALIMAVGRAMLADNKTSVYEANGVIFL